MNEARAAAKAMCIYTQLCVRMFTGDTLYIIRKKVEEKGYGIIQSLFRYVYVVWRARRRKKRMALRSF